MVHHNHSARTRNNTRIAGAIILTVAVLGSTQYGSADGYSSGAYGSCTYSSCGISLTSNSTVSLAISPSTSSSCTVQQDSVSVKTDASNGYTLSLMDTDNDAALTASSYKIFPVAGTPALPHALTANTWGYRVDAQAGFGATQTVATSNAAPTTQPYAPVPTNGSPAVLIATAVPSDPATNTAVWYGACVTSSLPSGTYTDQVLYTAVVN